MSGLQIRCEEGASQRTRLTLKGCLDGSTALELRDYLLNHPELGALALDFSQVRTYVDLAVAVLADTLGTLDILLEGLPRHQERVFRYFGIASNVDADRLRLAGAESLLAG